MHARPGAPATRRPQRQFRSDIEGLRAVAVLGVVLYHAHVGALSGGYAGVDVFFVISGYLITGLLWRELQRHGRIDLPAFYGRRARRLLPASILVIVVTAVAARHWLPPLETPAVAKDGLAAALYVANYRFAFAQTNYLNATTTPSPFQHYWSLGVEEQFYVLWPLLLLGASLVWRYRPRYQHQHRRRLPGAPTTGPDRRVPSRVSAGWVLAGVTAASFVLSLWLTHANQPWAFFSLPTRAWELGAGGVLALVTPSVDRLPRLAAGIVAWGGLAVIVASFLVIDATTPFPGVAAIFPVVGALAVLAGGGRAGVSGPVLLLGRPPMRMMGRISYSWYLWHWPFLILAPDALGHPLSLAQNLFVAFLSGLVAVVSFLLVENPVRTWAWLAALPRRSLLTGATLSAGGAAACLLVAATMPSLTGHGLAPVASIPADNTSPRVTEPSGSTPAGSGPTTTVDPLVAQAAAITAAVNAQVAASIGDMDVPTNLTPSLADAHESNSPTFYDGCMDSYLADDVENCAFGDLTSSTSVVLFGDSHAAMFFSAVDYAANQHGWLLYNWTKATCPPLENEPIFSPVLGRNFTECETWRQNALARIQQVHPALVIFGMSRDYTSIYGPDSVSYSPQWLSGLAQMVTTIRQMGAKVLVIGPVPGPPVEVYDCLSEHLTDAVACTWPVNQVIDEAGMAAERAAVTAVGGTYLDVQPWFCTAQTCGDMVGNILMWRDNNHISQPYSAFLGSAMSADLAEVVGPG